MKMRGKRVRHLGNKRSAKENIIGSPFRTGYYLLHEGGKKEEGGPLSVIFPVIVCIVAKEQKRKPQSPAGPKMPPDQ